MYKGGNQEKIRVAKVKSSLENSGLKRDHHLPVGAYNICTSLPAM